MAAPNTAPLKAAVLLDHQFPRGDGLPDIRMHSLRSSDPPKISDTTAFSGFTTFSQDFEQCG